jgi:hypothetical protein
MSCDILNNKIINDKDFLKTMIIHHKAAVDMSKIIYKSSTNDTILSFARNIIFNQTKEIYFMKTLYIDIKYSINEKNTSNRPLRNTFKSEYPNIFQDLKCDESHFNFNHHSNHNMTNEQYVKHMISHHNTALELSKLIIVSTKNPQILALAQLINLDQSKEIFELYFLEKSLKNHWINSFKPFKEYS